MNIEIIGNIIAVVVVRGLIDGGKPESIDAELFQMVKFLDDPLQITDAVRVRVAKGTRVDLVNGRFFPPCRRRFTRLIDRSLLLDVEQMKKTIHEGVVQLPARKFRQRVEAKTAEKLVFQ